MSALKWLAERIGHLSDDGHGGHWSWRGLTIYYGETAMHGALNLSTRWGFFCAHPTTSTFGGRWPWYVYLSPDATPSAAHWGFGPGFDDRDPNERRRCRERRSHHEAWS